MTVLVTGSSRGIGKAIAYAFGKKGYKIVLNGSKNKTALEQTKIEFLQQGLTVLLYLPMFRNMNNVKCFLVK